MSLKSSHMGSIASRCISMLSGNQAKRFAQNCLSMDLKSRAIALTRYLHRTSKRIAITRVGVARSRKNKIFSKQFGRQHGSPMPEEFNDWRNLKDNCANCGHPACWHTTAKAFGKALGCLWEDDIDENGKWCLCLKECGRCVAPTKTNRCGKTCPS